MEDAGTLDSVRDALLGQSDIELACVFGSFADGRQTPASDIDVAVAARAPIGAQRRLELIDAIASVTGRPVDLVDLHRAGPLVPTQALTKGKRIVIRENDRPDSGPRYRGACRSWPLVAGSRDRGIDRRRVRHCSGRACR